MKRLIYPAIAVFMCMLPARTVLADVPKLLNYQGRLTNASHQAVADDDYTVQFRLYISEAEVNSVWDETQTITTKDGYFHTLLGQVNALTPSLFNQPLWLGIQVQGEVEMTPRQQLASSPAALTVADGAITTSKIAEQSVQAGQIKTLPIQFWEKRYDGWLPTGSGYFNGSAYPAQCIQTVTINEKSLVQVFWQATIVLAASSNELHVQLECDGNPISNIPCTLGTGYGMLSATSLKVVEEGEHTYRVYLFTNPNPIDFAIYCPTLEIIAYPVE